MSEIHLLSPRFQAGHKLKRPDKDEEKHGKKQLYILTHHFVGEGKTFTEIPSKTFSVLNHRYDVKIVIRVYPADDMKIASRFEIGVDHCGG